MNKSISLTIQDRFDVMFNISRLPCTVALRFAYDTFYSMIEFSAEEIEKYAIEIDKENYGIKCNDPTYTKTLINVSDSIISTFNDFVKTYEDRKSVV